MNAIDLEIYWNRMISIVDEAGAALMRTDLDGAVLVVNGEADLAIQQEPEVMSVAMIPGRSSMTWPMFAGFGVTTGVSAAA